MAQLQKAYRALNNWAQNCENDKDDGNNDITMRC